MVPTFSGEEFLVEPPRELQRERNGWDHGVQRLQAAEGAPRFDPSPNDVGEALGIVPATVVGRPGRSRGRHPLWSFTAVGPDGNALVGAQGPDAATAPLRMLCDRDGVVTLMGVGLNRCSLLHYAEELAGRQLFYRWALDSQGEVVDCQVGGCSDGFGHLVPALESHASTAFVGESQWIVLPANDAAHAAASAIRSDPTVTHCGRSDCNRCNDAVAGGPLPRPRART